MSGGRKVNPASLILPALLASSLMPATLAGQAQRGTYRSPIHISLSHDGRKAYVVNQTANSISVIDIESRQVVNELSVGPRPSQAALSPDGAELYVTCTWGSSVDVLDLALGRVVRSLGTGLEPGGLSVSPDGRLLYVANAMSDTVSIIDAKSGNTLSEFAAGRQPMFLVNSPGGSRVLVAGSLSRKIVIIDTGAGRVVENRDLGRANLLRGVACSSDGKWAFVAHVLSHDEATPFQMERGFIHANGFSILRLNEPGHRVTLLLDQLLVGAANPWGLALSSDDSRLYVSLAGVHEIAIVDVPAALRLVENARQPAEVAALENDVEIMARLGIARRVTAGGIGPRGIALSEATGELLVANYFSDTVSVLGADGGELRAVISLGPPQPMTTWRNGEMLFNDARLCFQKWFSCASCHQEDATMDGLNWDLPNDGVGNTKNVKSMHDAHDTPPAMWGGVRSGMDAAVAAGQRFLGFLPKPENHAALLAYLGDPPRAPNPHLGQAPESSRRGKTLFHRARCHVCHPAPKYTDLRKHDVGLAATTDLRSRFDTPSLRDCYRSGPFLHDGRAETLERTEIFGICVNRGSLVAR